MKIITFILLIFSSVCYSQIINFPDSNFKNALLNIKSNYNVSNVEIFNTMGQKVSSEENQSTTGINVSSQSDGIYFLKLIDVENSSTVKKFIKK